MQEIIHRVPQRDCKEITWRSIYVARTFAIWRVNRTPSVRPFNGHVSHKFFCLLMTGCLSTTMDLYAAPPFCYFFLLSQFLKEVVYEIFWPDAPPEVGGEAKTCCATTIAGERCRKSVKKGSNSPFCHIHLRKSRKQKNQTTVKKSYSETFIKSSKSAQTIVPPTNGCSSTLTPSFEESRRAMKNILRRSWEIRCAPGPHNLGTHIRFSRISLLYGSNPDRLVAPWFISGRVSKNSTLDACSSQYAWEARLHLFISSQKFESHFTMNWWIRLERHDTI